MYTVFMLIKCKIELAQENLHSGTFKMHLNVETDDPYRKVTQKVKTVTRLCSIGMNTVDLKPISLEEAVLCHATYSNYFVG